MQKREDSALHANLRDVGMTEQQALPEGPPGNRLFQQVRRSRSAGSREGSGGFAGS